MSDTPTCDYHVSNNTSGGAKERHSICYNCRKNICNECTFYFKPDAISIDGVVTDPEPEFYCHTCYLTVGNPKVSKNDAILWTLGSVIMWIVIAYMFIGLFTDLAVPIAAIGAILLLFTYFYFITIDDKIYVRAKEMSLSFQSKSS